MKNRISGLLMETGVSYNKQRLHKVGYFRELLSTNEDVHDNIRPLLKLSRDTGTTAENGICTARKQEWEEKFEGADLKPSETHEEISVAEQNQQNNPREATKML